MAKAVPIRMMSPEDANSERTVFHPETDIDYVAEYPTDGSDPVPLPDVIARLHPVISTTNPGGNGEKIWFHETRSATTSPIG